MVSHRLTPICFVVDETPYCVWEYDLPERTREFLDQLRPDYFDHLAKLYSEEFKGDDVQMAAMNLRLAYSHGLETLFALLCATIQAPDCVVGWLVRYKVANLVSVVRKLREYESPLSRLVDPISSWEDVARIIHSPLALDDKELEGKVKEAIGVLWSRFADDFLDDQRQFEYNSMKHGLRVRPGGFYLRRRRESTPGIPDPSAPVVSLGGSPFGSTFFRPENIGTGNTHFRIRKCSLNWNPENLLHGLNLISMSLQNVISFLRWVNGADISKLQWEYARDLEFYNEPWRRAVGTRGVNIDTSIDEADIRRFTKEEIRRSYERAEMSRETDEGEPKNNGPSSEGPAG